MAGLGITEIEVFRRPVVSIISTGDEIVSASGAVKPGQVRDINSYTLWGLIREHGGVPVKRGIYVDDYEVLKKAVADALRDADVVLITGGTSAGAKDMTSALINGMGTPGVLFHGVSLKPGKPMIGGVVGRKALFGLPGHPAAVAVCFDLFIRPVLDRLCGRSAVEPFTKTVRATMAKRIASSAGREDHVRVSLELRDGRWVAVPVLGKSGLITTLVKADGVVVIPGGRLGLDEGDEVEVKLFA
jgi:molybdopterin molybdotransferase